MKDEIREILDDNGELMVRYKDYTFECFDTLPKNVLDYIINLQEGNHNLLQEIEDMQNKNNELIEENETLRKNQRYYKNGVFSLEYDKETMSDIIDDYKSRNEKAIEYVNTHKPSDTISFPLMKKDEENQVKSCFDYEFREIYQKELLNILQGEDKNEK